MILKLINFIKHVKKIVTDKIFHQNVVEPDTISLNAEISHDIDLIPQPSYNSGGFFIIKQYDKHMVIITDTFDHTIRNTVHSKKYTVPDG